jgi:hemoglobin-like flavoprotein
MTTNNVELVKNSWALVAAMDMELVGGLFYNKLFQTMPEVKPMFSKTAMPEQSKKLLTMLSYVIAKLDKLEDIIEEVAKLARRHEGYGVTEMHYTAVGTALLWTLEQGLGAEWNLELKFAWVEVYTVLSEAMINAAKAVA